MENHAWTVNDVPRGNHLYAPLFADCVYTVWSVSNSIKMNPVNGDDADEIVLAAHRDNAMKAS